MVLRSEPEVHGRHLAAVIGQPMEYTKNVESGQFAQHYDLRIPAAAETSRPSISYDEVDIAGALNDGEKNVQEEQKQVRRSYVQSN